MTRNTTRRDVLKLGGAIGVLGTTAAALTSFAIPARAAEFTYKYANNLPVTHPMNARAKEAADKIEKETNGRVAIQIFPSNQLGSDTTCSARCARARSSSSRCRA